ncbi:helix-turn-helix transcriptional regulator [Sanguibacter suaedae]|uniref:WYL domain-containing protein n=1 Tax=Sanguibacter suaedae TaxID=2795737 RepID=A0A934MC43_9MICO|nr:WYL domain-containing protein [Sanguibacter suaedae]MBI9113519.1 WYL domain-containing protein [Sanguibacter suaedae]
MTGSSSRMLALLSLLQTRRDWPGHVLAERLGVTPRTVRRDVDRLRGLGYEVAATKGPDGGYRLGAGMHLPPLLLDDAQAVAVAVALQHVPASGVDLEEAAERALLTVRQVMPSRLRHRLDAVRFTTTGPGGDDARVDPAVLEAVSTAVQERRTLRFDYAGRDGLPRRAEPHALVARAGRWFVVAWDLDRDDWRTFRVDRMAPRTPAGAVFAPREIPASDAASFLEARLRGATHEEGWPCVGTVEIGLPASEVVPWAGDGTVEALGPRSCRVTVGSWSWAGVLASVARFDAPFTVVGPEELRDAAVTLAQRCAASAEPPTSRVDPAR